MSLPRLAVSRPVTMLMAIVSVLVIGGIALGRLPLAFLPTLDIPFIGVSIPYPNSNPTQIEKEITKPVEEVLSTLAGVKKLRSTSSADGAEFEMEFTWGQDLDVLRMQVSEKMEQVKNSLPAGIGEVIIFSFNTDDIPVIQARIAAEGVDLSDNYDLIEARVANRLRRVPGVARVDVGGVEPREISIDLVLDKIKEHAVDVSVLIERLQGATTNLVLGQVNKDGMRYTARALGAFDSVEELRNLTINERGLKLSDVAEVRYEEPPITYGRHLDTKFAIAVEVYKESTANTVDVVHAAMKVIEEDIHNDPLLQGIDFFVWQDQAEAITGGISGLTSSGTIGALLAVAILYFFLRRLDSTIIISLSIPFSIIASCGVLYFMGRSLNILSMMGLMLGVGMLVDNAIVVLDSIDRKHRAEPDTRKSAVAGAREVSMAVTSSTLTTVIVFLPIIVGSGTELTAWLGEVGLTISLALGCSLVSALTLIPLMSAHLLRARQEAPPNRPLVWLEHRYVGVLGWTLRHKVWTAVLLVVGLGVGLVVPFAAGLVETGMFSATVNKLVFLNYEFSDFTYKSEAEDAVDEVERYLMANKERFEIASLYSFFEENRAFTVLNMARDNIDDRSIKELRKQIREELPEVPGARIFFHEDAESGGDSTYFAVKFFGQDSGVLRGFAQEASRRLETIDDIEDISTSVNRGRQEIQVVIDRDKAVRAGLTAQDVARIFSFTLGGMRLQRFNAGDREVETWLSLRLEDRENLDDLKKLQIGGGADGRPIQLGDIASFQTVRREQEITRENRKVRVAVNATYEGEKWSETKEQIAGLMDAFEMPPGYSWSWDDRIVEQGEEDAQMLINFALALILVYIVMASLFESLAQPFAILFSIPFSVVGAAWMLAATRTPFNIMAQIGLLILIGIVVNNGIVLLDRMNQLRQAGLSRDDAVLQAGRDRLRAILMTATTTVVGLLPLAIGGAKVGGVYYFPLARTVMGGLISSTVLTLIVLPYLALRMEALADWCRRIWRASSPAPKPVPEASPGAVPDLMT